MRRAEGFCGRNTRRLNIRSRLAEDQRDGRRPVDRAVLVCVALDDVGAVGRARDEARISKKKIVRPTGIVVGR